MKSHYLMKIFMLFLNVKNDCLLKFMLKINILYTVVTFCYYLCI